MPREVRQVLRLALRQAAAAQCRHVGRGDFCRGKPPELVCRRIVRHGDKAPPDRVGCLDRYLLADDRPGQRREGIGAALQMDAGVSADQPAQGAVAARELARGLVPERRLHRLRRLARRGPAADRRGRQSLRPYAALRRNGRRAGAGSGTLRAFRRRGIDAPSVSALRRRRQACLLALSGVAAQIASAAADPNKVLHVAIEAGDDGFDPSRSTNYYSGLIEEVIFDRLLTYDYLAEPVKLVPMLAEAMPEVGDGGKTYTFHLRKGVYFTPGPRVQERQARARRGRRRLLDQALPRSEESLAMAISVRRQDRRPERAGSAGEKERRPLRLRRQDSRARSRRSLYGPLSSDRHRLQLRLHIGIADEQHRRARSHRALQRRYQGASGRLRAVHAGGVAAGRPHPAARQSRISRLRLGLPAVGQSVGPGRRRGDEGQADAADRRRRRAPDGGGAVALARVPGRGDRLHRSFRLVCADGHSEQQGCTGSGQARHQALSLSRAGDDLLLLQHGRSGGRRIRQGEDRAAARDRDVVRHRRGNTHHPQEPGDPRRVADSARRRRLRARTTARAITTILRWRTSCSTISDTSAAPTATGRCRTASRC